MTTATGLQAQTNADLAAGQSRLQRGVCVSIDWPSASAVVNFPGASLSLPMCGAPPIIGEECWILYSGSSRIILGPVSRPPFGTVAGSQSGGLVNVAGDDSIVRSVTYSAGDTLASGTRVLIDWTSGGEIVGTPQADPNTGQPINPNTGGGGGSKAQVFYPNDSGTWRDGTYASGWVGGGLWDSDHNHGAYFYSGIADTIPDNATVIRFNVYMPAGDGYGGNPTVGGHALAAQGPALSVTSPRAFSPGQGWVNLSDLFDSFKTGALLGVGTAGGGNWQFGGVGGLNGAIDAAWSTP